MPHFFMHFDFHTLCFLKPMMPLKRSSTEQYKHQDMNAFPTATLHQNSAPYNPESASSWLLILKTTF